MPLVRDRDFYTLGLECLLAYYGVNEDAVEFSENNDRLKVNSLAGSELLNIPLYKDQMLGN